MLDLAQWPGSIGYGTRPLSGITGVTIHYTAGSATASPRDIAAYQISPEAVKQLNLTPPQPFPAIAYTLYVDSAGQVYLCHDLTTRVWHSGARVNNISRNTSHLSVCYGGNYTPNAAQIAGIREAVHWCSKQLGRALTLEGHRDAPYNTSCPGPTWPNWRAQII